jgi:uncharacterized membrane protein
MRTFMLPLAIGIVAGLRSMTAPAAVSWAARVGWLDLSATPLAFVGYAFTPWILTAFALGELVADKLPTTPSRRTTIPFSTRVLTGGLSGAVIGAASGEFGMGAVGGVLGGVIGTLGGHAFRARLAAAFGQDRPAALIEDAVAIGGAFLIMAALR